MSLRVTCAGCGADFVFPDEQIPPEGKSSSCPFCNVVFQVSETPNGERLVSFANERKNIRSCIQCSKEFEAEGNEAIPICPACKSETTRTEEASKRPTSEPPVSPSLSFQKPRPSDDKIFRPKSSVLSRPLVPRAITSTLRYVSFTTWFLLAALIFSAGWIVYRFATYELPPALRDPSLSLFIADLARKHPIARMEPVQEDIKWVIGALSKDSPQDLETVRTVLETMAVSHPDSSVIISRLSETYARLAAYSETASTRVSVMDFANLVTQVFPNEVDGHVAKARAALIADNFSVAQAEAQKALELAPGSPEAMLAQGLIQAAQLDKHHNTDFIIRSAQAAITGNSRLLEAFDLLGHAYIVAGRPLEARNAFEDRLTLQPDDAKAIFRLGQIEERAGNFLSAREWYMRALRQDPEFSEARLALAVSYRHLDKNLRLAESHLRQILTRYHHFTIPKHTFQAQQELASILVETGRSSEALKVIQESPPLLAGGSEAKLFSARVSIATGDRSGAIAALQQLVQEETEIADVYILLARLLFAQEEKKEDAVKLYRSAISKNPRWVAPYLYLADALIQLNRNSEALDVANAALTRAGIYLQDEIYRPLGDVVEYLPWQQFTERFERLAKEQKEQAPAHALLGYCFLERAAQEQNTTLLRRALASFEKARNLDRAAEYTAIYLGRTQLALGSLASALSTFQAALKINPASPMASYFLGLTHARAGRSRLALEALTSAMEDKEWGYRALSVAGEAALELGEKDRAAENWTRALDRNPRYIPPWKNLLQYTSL